MKGFTQEKCPNFDLCSSRHSASDSNHWFVLTNEHVRSKRRYFMTANQINFAKQREEARHNLVSEGQKERDIAIGERTAAAAELQAQTASSRQIEDARHNQVGEQINWFSAIETGRHNLAGETIQSRLAGETVRHNRAAESVQQGTLAESIRHNKIGEAQAARDVTTRERAQQETARHNVAQESIGRSQVGASYAQVQASQAQANAALQQAQVREGELAETIRKNSLTIAEQTRHNVAQEMIAGRQASTAQYDAATRRRQLSATKEQAAAATTQAQVAKSKAPSEIFKNYATGAGSALNSGVQVGKLAASMLGGLS